MFVNLVWKEIKTLFVNYLLVEDLMWGKVAIDKEIIDRKVIAIVTAINGT